MHKSNSELDLKIARLAQELDEAREQQAATADVLRAISRSDFDLDTVLRTLVGSAIRLCDATRGVIWLRRGEQLFLAAHVNYPQEWVDAVRDTPLTPAADAQTTSGLAAFTGAIVHVEDVPNDPRFRSLAAHKLGDYRAGLAVPLKRGGEVVGTISLSRPEARLFTERQIALVQTFADQAVIAIENVRLFEEVQARNREVTEALEQQGATSDVLRAISTSPTNIQPVFQAIVESAAKLCKAQFCFVDRFDGELLHFMAGHGLTPEAVDAINLAFPMAPGRGSTAARAIVNRAVAQIPDFRAEPGYEMGALVDIMGIQSGVAVPLLKDGMPIGVITVDRIEAGFFPDRQIELLQTFADQAVIAIENVRLFEEVQARNRDVTEALEQQTATADVLKTISSSAFDLDAVLHTLVKSASDLCHAPMGCIYLRDGDDFRVAMQVGWTDEFYEFMSRHPMRAGTGSVTSRTALTAAIVHIPDAAADADYTFTQGQKIGGFRTVLGVPLLRDGRVMGVFVLARPTVRPFGQREIELVQTFSDQAVIALENVRLFEEVQARNREVTEALERQTATGAILRVIAESPTDIQPVLDAVAESAARLCDAYDATIYLLRADWLAVGAHHGPIPIDDDGLPVARDVVTGRAVLDRTPVHIHDLTVAGEEFATGRMMAHRLGFRTILATPLLQEGEAIGALMIRRTEARPFGEGQIDLLKTFANQAVIAISNVRLFEEVQARTAELSEALQQQTATADVLKAISRSAFDLGSVLQTLINSAAGLCDAKASGIYMRDGDVFRLAASQSEIPEYEEYERANPSPLHRKSWIGRTALDKAIVHIPDVSLDLEHGIPDAPRIGGHKSVLCVPLMREGSVIGVFSMSRPEVGPFTKRQIELVRTFADQAVIAIENARLFEEVQERTRDLEEALTFQKATAEVLEVIGRSTSQLQPVLDIIVETSAELCRAEMSILRLLKDDAFHLVAANMRNDPRFVEYDRNNPVRPGRSSVAGRVALERRTVHVRDVAEDPEYSYFQNLGETYAHTTLGVPLLREGQVVGVIILLRKRVDPFTERQIALVETFADQAVIALSNVRLFEAVQARTEELARSLADLRAAQNRLVQTEKLASLGQLTAGIAHEIKNPLNFVNNFSSLSVELVDELREVLDRVALDGKAREEVDELTGLLKGNLDKVVQHGGRADSIVKNMLMHSRAGSGEHRPTSVNAVVEEGLNLAYHGARAERKDFNITLQRDFDAAAGDVDLYPQEITRVLLNLISNGFYATAKRGVDANGAAYQPVLTASTKNLGDSVEIRIRDNGTGIPPEVKEKMFNPFFTTKPAGEGTGLGLSLSHDIIVKQHAGTIEVDTEPGLFTEFRIVLPRRGASLTIPGDPA